MVCLSAPATAFRRRTGRFYQWLTDTTDPAKVVEPPGRRTPGGNGLELGIPIVAAEGVQFVPPGPVGMSV